MAMIDLWSKHEADFDPFGHIDHAYTNASDEPFDKAYEWLFKELGTDQVIWTYADPESLCFPHGKEFKLWHLRVPEEAILGVLHDVYWDLLLNMGICFTDDEYDYWEKNVDSKAPLDDLVELQLRRDGSTDANWRKYVFDCPNILEHQILIPAPLKPEWVVDVTHASAYDRQELEMQLTSTCFDTEEEMLQYKTIIEALLKGSNIQYEVTYCGRKFQSWYLRIEWEDVIKKIA